MFSQLAQFLNGAGNENEFVFIYIQWAVGASQNQDDVANDFMDLFDDFFNVTQLFTVIAYLPRRSELILCAASRLGDE